MDKKLSRQPQRSQVLKSIGLSKAKLMAFFWGLFGAKEALWGSGKHINHFPSLQEYYYKQGCRRSGYIMYIYIYWAAGGGGGGEGPQDSAFARVCMYVCCF